MQAQEHKLCDEMNFKTQKSYSKKYLQQKSHANDERKIKMTKKPKNPKPARK